MGRRGIGGGLYAGLRNIFAAKYKNVKEIAVEFIVYSIIHISTLIILHRYYFKFVQENFAVMHSYFPAPND